MARIKMRHKRLVLLACLIAAGLSACASVKIPKLDLIKLPDFRAESEELGEYPAVEDAPTLPTEVRTDRQWDRVAKDIIRVRDSFNAPQEPERVTAASDIEREIDRLTDVVNEYRADDPPEN